ncbi:hypothetical protein [Lacrimispora sphenoides]|uniref:Uncharacterized protein n=1 Tax=Lacrimispora sphenoides JCM 1415 TaxID=1297793 RepID=A0ABY1CGP3_9FIRM|nr:hypothetical protein [Lacrimispora sphenoides]SEU03411.1 hypothetical protein SAMN02745906_4188 [[Clostridium] sphenoides JCM 1415]SUY48775.1 Uncharacterised protein [Lacrimispora sphenoides]
MSYEINIIAINQDKPIQQPFFNSSILLHNEKENIDISRYVEIWPFFSATKGILYSLVVEMNEGYYSAFPLCDSDFDVSLPEDMLLIKVLEEERENLTAFIIKETYYKDFVKLVKFLIENAPNKRILFQTRYQGGDKELVIGVIKWTEFLTMLAQKQIFFNICYIIEED